LISVTILLIAFTAHCVAEDALQFLDEPHCPKLCACSSHLKRVSCINVGLVSIPDDIPTCVTELYLSKNYLTGIPARTFQNLSNLTILSLEYNHLTRIEDGAFLGLTKLKQLTLRTNQLMNLSPGVFCDLVSLHDLYITDNKLTSIPDVGYAKNLTYLTLDNNQIKSAKIPLGFRNLTLLSSLILSNNPPLTKIRKSEFWKPAQPEVAAPAKAGGRPLGEPEDATTALFASPGCKKWDTCAPEAVLHAIGGRLTDVHGNFYTYAPDVKHVNSGGTLATALADEHAWYLGKMADDIRKSLPA
jgi:hypothetical protein